MLACVLERRMTSFGRGNIISLGEVGMYMGVGVDAKSRGERPGWKEVYLEEKSPWFLFLNCCDFCFKFLKTKISHFFLFRRTTFLKERGLR